MVLLARDNKDDPALPALLDAIAAQSGYHTVLTLLAAAQIGDVDRLERALHHPWVSVRRVAATRLPLARDPQALAATYLEASDADRAAFRKRLRAENRSDVVTALLPHDLSDTDRAVLLATADAATVARLLPDLADLVPSVRALAARHPEAVLEHLAMTADSAPETVRDRAWAWAGPALPLLARDHPDRVLDLLDAAPPAHMPRGVTASLATLTRRSPSRVAALLARPRTEWPAHLPGKLVRLFRTFGPDERVRLLRRARQNPQHVVALLGALPPSERADAYDRAGLATPGATTPRLLLEELPHDLRHAEARHQQTLLAGHRAAQGDYAAFLPFEEARGVLDPLLASADAAERSAAYTGLLTSAGRERSAEVWERAVPLLERLGNEQDPVRLAAATGLAQVPIGISATGPLEQLRRFVAAVVSARDTSPGTLHTLQNHCWAAIQHGAERRRPDVVAAHLPILDQLCGPDGTTAVPDLQRLPHGTETLVVDALLPRIRPAARRDDRRLLHSLVQSLGQRAYAQTELQGLLRDHVRSSFRGSDVRTSISLWLADPAHKGERVAEVLRKDQSTATLWQVQHVLMAKRQDLADVLWQARPLKGRFHDGRTRYVPLLAENLHRLLPRQLDAYAAALTAAAQDENRSWFAASAVRQLGRLPGVGATRLQPFLASPKIALQEAALAALAWTDDPAVAIDRLLVHRGDDRARVATYALNRCARHARPQDLVARLAALLAPGSKVTSAKEGVRLLGALRPPGALEVLLDAVGATSHLDVRIALARTVRDFLDDERAWQVLDAAARATRDEARSLAETTPQQLAVRHRARYAGVLQTASAATPEIAGSLGSWVVWQPGLVEVLTAQVAAPENRGWLASVAALSAALDEGGARREMVALMTHLADHALDADQPDAAAERDLPLLARLDELVETLVAGDDLRPLCGEAAGVLAARPSGRGAALRMQAAAIEPADPASGVRALCDLAEDPVDASLVRLLLGRAAQLRRCSDEELSGAYAVVADDPSAVAGAAALALVETRTSQHGWDEPWRERVRGLRRHPVPAVADWARHVRTASE